MAKHRSYSVEFKRQVVQDYLTGETLHGIAKRHDISRNLIRIWIAKHEAGALDSDTAAASMLTEYEARIAALERLVGKLALENEFLKGASGRVGLPRSASIAQRRALPLARRRGELPSMGPSFFFGADDAGPCGTPRRLRGIGSDAPPSYRAHTSTQGPGARIPAMSQGRRGAGGLC